MVQVFLGFFRFKSNGIAYIDLRSVFVMAVICFGGEDWWYHNRAHIDFQLMKRFARHETTLYVNSIVLQKPKLAQGRQLWQKVSRKAKSIFNGLKKSDVGFWVYSPFTLPVHHISGARQLNAACLHAQLFGVMHKLSMNNPLVWVACPAACDVAIKMKKSQLVYQRTDIYEHYPNVDVDIIKTYDQKLKTHADLTVFVNQQLYEAEADQCRQSLYLDHGVDYDYFSQAQDDPSIPEDIKEIPGPIIGFFGSINGHVTVDVPLIEQVADLLPEMSLVLIGKPHSDCSKLFARSNVYWLGQKDYSEIAHYGKCFDVAMMPWQQNDWISGCNPIKLKEYLALGKPIVSTSFSELLHYRDVVYEATSAVEFAQRVKQALAEDSQQRLEARRNRVRTFTWDVKAQEVMTKLCQIKKP
jgi:glycosyltransferase involved in cell wall biosynthesis